MSEQHNDEHKAAPMPMQLRAIGEAAVVEAELQKASAVEAEHVLLALAADSGSVVSNVLAAAGLDHDGIVAALHEEQARSLTTAGAGHLKPTPSLARRSSRLRWGASVRSVIAGLKVQKQRRGRSLQIELAIGVLEPDFGTVPRALALAGVDRAALRETLVMHR